MAYKRKRSFRDLEHDYTVGTPASCPSAQTRRLVHQREKDSCWLCGLIGVCITPIIAQTDAILFEAYCKQGVLTMSDPQRDANNLMLLCSGCSTNFDQRVPIWVFLPADLDMLIKGELEFQLTRKEYAEQGWEVERRSEAGSKILYTRYLVREGYIHNTPFIKSPHKTWSGDPVAAIIRSQSIISGIQLLPASAGGIPAATAKKLVRLIMLYSDTPPALVQDGDEPDDTDEEQLMDGSMDGRVESESEAIEEDADFRDEFEEVRSRCRVLEELLHDDTAVPETWSEWKARLADLQYRWNIITRAIVELDIEFPPG